MGADHPETLRYTETVARALDAMGCRTEAIELQAEVFETRRARLGPRHFLTLQSMQLLSHFFHR